MTQWEYRTETIDSQGNYVVARHYVGRSEDPYGEGYDANKWASMNELGAEGWELVSVNFGEGDEATGIFKRPVIQETDIDGGPIQPRSEDIEQLKQD